MPKRSAIIAFMVAERVNNKKFIELGMADAGHATLIIQGFYDPATRTVTDLRILVSDNPPDPKITELLEEGNGATFLPFHASPRYPRRRRKAS